MNLGSKKTPLELLEIATAGGAFESVQRVMTPVLGQEINLIISQLAACKPDLGTYAHIAGQAYVINKLLNTLRITLDEAKEANAEVRKSWKS